MSNPECNILKSLNEQQYNEFRQQFINAILNTDMSLHFELLSKVNTRLSSGTPFSKEKIEDRKLVAALFLHTADISNPAKPANVRKWSDLVFEEFLQQVSSSCFLV